MVQAIAKHQGNISDVNNSVARKYTTEQMVNIIASQGQMIATNVFNNVTETEIDEYLTRLSAHKQIHRLI